MTTASLQSIPNTEHWVEFAVCSQVDAEIFFPNRGESPEEAKKVCRGCEVKAECLAWALEHNETGVWGALSEKERKALKRTLKRDDGRCSNGHDLAVAGVYPSGYCRQCSREREQRYAVRRSQGRVPAEHGSRSRHRSGCRCDLCGVAERVHQQSRPPRRRSVSLSKGAR